MPIKNLQDNVDYQRFAEILEDMLGTEAIPYLYVGFDELPVGPGASVPIIKVWCMAPGYVLGVENMISYGISFNMWPTDANIKDGFRKAYTYIREQKAAQREQALAQAQADFVQENGKPERPFNPQSPFNL